MGLARSQRSEVEFLIALRSRCGQLAELSLRASPSYLASLLLVKCRLLRREWLEKLFRVASRRESGVDSLLLWRADSAMLCRRASRMWRVPLGGFVQAVQLRRVSLCQPVKQSYLLLPLRLLRHPLLWCRLW